MNKVVVTTSWDDGHAFDKKLADLLLKYGIKGTFYISPKNRELKPEDRLSDTEVLRLSENFEIGAHTMTHPHLTKIDLNTAKEEIVGSKKYLEGILNKEIKSFCYPAGYYDGKHKKILEDAGFALARTVNRHATSVGKDKYEMPTTIHAYRHFSDARKILSEVGPTGFVKSYFRWDDLAIKAFDKTLQKGGVFHLWGHSWELEKNKDWERLEKVLKHISNRKDVDYVTNSELV